ncbi:enoyl-CoA hydratase [Marivibrio halodurans]|uniref:Enoyl-CoA hydratase domain-containing protein 3, mitochondrial n=1 Tax=Marivibrio halodurans TaxID=2039722 RepID=A0A8J7V0G8_9PROT|nr:enoyl-CoA hydratase [Marivibrio halodurans]MBP5856786.1 enoyl-CoA hydratase [Marivibrio halodurans]
MSATADTSTPPDTAEPLLLRRDGAGVARLTLNRPKAYNALSVALMEAVLAELQAIDRDPAIKVLVIEGAGKGFCAGHDLRELKDDPSTTFRERTFDLCSRMMQAVVGLRQPTIAKVHGIATAAGCQLVASCDLAVAAADARFGTPGVNIGLFCSTPMVALSRAVPRKQAMEMLLTGDMIPADRALAHGLVNRVVPGDAAALEEETATLAAKVADKSSKVLKTGKEAFYRQIEMPLAEAYDYTAGVMVENMGYRDADEGIGAFLEKRKPVWTGE